MRNQLDKLMKWRLRTKQKPNVVWLYYGFSDPVRLGGFDLHASKPSKTDDYRSLIGVHVVVCSKHYSAALMDEFERLKGYAAGLTLWVEDWSDDLDSVLTWFRGRNADIH